MATDPNEGKRRRDDQRGNRSKAPKSLFYTFRPNQEDASKMADFTRDLREVFCCLNELQERGLSLKVSAASFGDGWMASAFVPADFGVKTPGLTVWAPDPVRCLIMLLYALEVVYPGFPQQKWPPVEQVEFTF